MQKWLRYEAKAPAKGQFLQTQSEKSKEDQEFYGSCSDKIDCIWRCQTEWAQYTANLLVEKKHVERIKKKSIDECAKTKEEFP